MFSPVSDVVVPVVGFGAGVAFGIFGLGFINSVTVGLPVSVKESVALGSRVTDKQYASLIPSRWWQKMPFFAALGWLS